MWNADCAIAAAKDGSTTPDVSSVLIGHAFDEVVASTLAAESTPAYSPQPDLTPAPTEEAHPAPEHTGWATLGKDLWNDFKAFPQRPSTWVILGIGAASAALVHPIDDDVNAHLVGKRGLARMWAPGKYVGTSAPPTRRPASRSVST